MRATRVEIRTAALRAGRVVDGAWEPAGQLIATVYVVEPQAVEEVAARLRTATAIDGEAWAVTVGAREFFPDVV